MTRESTRESTRTATQPQDVARGEGLELFLTYRLHLLNKITDAKTDARYKGELGITLGMARCVAALGSFGSLSVNALGVRANLDKSQASRVADALSEGGFVQKAPSTHRRALVCPQ